MVNSISSFDPQAYLDQIKGAKPKPAESTNSSSSTNTNSTSSSSKPTANTLGISTEILSLLQAVDPESSRTNLVANLTGRVKSGVLGSQLTNEATIKPLTEAQRALKIKAAVETSVAADAQRTIALRNAAQNAYNKVLLQNAKDAVKENNGQLPS